MSVESVMPSNHLSLCHHLDLPPSIFPRIRVFSKESVLPIRWQNYWDFSFSISPFNEHSGLISFKIDWTPCYPRDSRVFSNTTVQKYPFFSTQLSLWSNSYTPRVQFKCSVMSNSQQPHGLQHARLPRPSPTPRTCSKSCPSNQ